jgi:hypothetical protein
MELGTFDDRRHIELASLKSQRERHAQPSQIQAAGDHGVPQPDTPRIDLVPELMTTSAKHASIDRPADGTDSAIEDSPGPAIADQLTFADLVHRCPNRRSGDYR